MNIDVSDWKYTRPIPVTPWFFSVNKGVRLSFDISVRQCVLISSSLLMCPFVRFVCPIDQIIYQSVDRWILIYGILNRHGLYVNLCPPIGIWASTLIYKSVNASWYILYYWYFPLSVLSVRWYINWFIYRSIGEYWCLWFEIDTARPCHPSICVRW